MATVLKNGLPFAEQSAIEGSQMGLIVRKILQHKNKYVKNKNH